MQDLTNLQVTNMQKRQLTYCTKYAPYTQIKVHARVGCELGLREPIRKLFTRVGHEPQVRDL